IMDSEAHEKRLPILISSKQDISPHITNVGEMKHYLCGCCAAFNNITILYSIKTRDAILRLRRVGFRNLYHGILPPLMQKTTTLEPMFGLYKDLSCLLHKHVSAPEFAARGVAAVLSGTTEAIFTPLERVQTLLQDHKHHDTFTNTYQAFKALKLLIWSMILSVEVYWVPCWDSCFFPVNVVKTHMWSQIGGEFQSFPQVFQKAWLERDRKLINLFRGAYLNYHRSLISWGIINATYKFLLKIICKKKSVKCHLSTE
uniref:Solute carrier family 25 member 51 n=1 Tax=Gorilla gorilla gorilla TaxID=9595 RepID=A0A2I2YEX7_GORGO